MGLSSSKSTVKPVYGAQIEGASKTLSNAYSSNAPKIQATADSLTGLLPSMIAKYQAGNPALNAASGYVTDTLGGDGLNPNIDAWVSQQQDATGNALGAKLAKMGLNPAGSTYQGLQARELGKVALDARTTDWNNAQARKAQAAGMASGISSAETASIAPLLSVADVANNPLQAAVGYSSGMGGLLGGYTNTKTKNAWGPILAQAAANAAAAYAGGG